MDVALLRHHRGALTASMCGGTLYYTPDITVADPVFHEVYDFGPCTGASVFTLTPDDNFIILVGSPRELLPEAPTDPDVRISRIRLFGSRLRYVTGEVRRRGVGSG
jgi:hypothetical protein